MTVQILKVWLKKEYDPEFHSSSSSSSSTSQGSNRQGSNRISYKSALLSTFKAYFGECHHITMGLCKTDITIKYIKQCVLKPFRLTLTRDERNPEF